MGVAESKYRIVKYLDKWRCLRCGGTWLPRHDAGGKSLGEIPKEDAAYPVVCMNCNSPYWDTPRQDEEALPLFVTVPVAHFKCIRCNETWIPNDPEKPPRKCARCGNVYWRRLKKKRKKEKK